MIWQYLVVAFLCQCREGRCIWKEKDTETLQEALRKTWWDESGNFDQLQKRIPERIIEHAVRGMLPKGRLGRSLFNHLKVYTGPDHPHAAQKPVELPIRDKRIQKQA
ncbi:UNVERIFIED_CONTAM: 50S ribosomal protein L13, chloroplastic [Sesamum angustifolium]|uniref:50S ribosomal protein L13, chloroplastic n=1 Tax=Sesamum angustifolium TaxID=2727405 RepID=A0AAW2KYT5_9LAMI